MLLRKVTLKPYIIDLWIIITDNPKVDIPKLNKKYKGLDLTWDEETAAWTNDHIYDGYILGVLFDVEYFEPDTVAHEAVHILNRTYEHAGAFLDMANDEPQAYMTGFIVGEIHKAHQEFIKKQKNKYNAKK